jgi:hypothetical protein
MYKALNFLFFVFIFCFYFFEKIKLIFKCTLCENTCIGSWSIGKLCAINKVVNKMEIPNSIRTQ